MPNRWLQEKYKQIEVNLWYCYLNLQTCNLPRQTCLQGNCMTWDASWICPPPVYVLVSFQHDCSPPFYSKWPDPMATSPCRPIALFLNLLWGSTVLFLSSSAELQWFEHPAKSDGSLSLLAVGDWGRRGTYNQSQVAYQVEKFSCI